MKVKEKVICSGASKDCPKKCPHRKPHFPRKAYQSDWDGGKPCIMPDVCGSNGIVVMCKKMIKEG